MDPIQNNPLAFRLAQTYGLRPVQPARAAPAGAGTRTGEVFSAGGASPPTDTVELSANVAARERIASLVAAKVPGSIDFTLTNEGVMTPGQAGALKLYRQPADLNAAATGVALGRSLDLEA